MPLTLHPSEVMTCGMYRQGFIAKWELKHTLLVWAFILTTQKMQASTELCWIKWGQSGSCYSSHTSSPGWLSTHLEVENMEQGANANNCFSLIRWPCPQVASDLLNARLSPMSPQHCARGWGGLVLILCPPHGFRWKHEAKWRLDIPKVRFPPTLLPIIQYFILW